MSPLVALYGAPLAGQAEPLRLWTATEDDAAVVTVLPLPLRSECPRCRDLMAEGGPLALILSEDDYCLAPYTHSLM